MSYDQICHLLFSHTDHYNVASLRHKEQPEFSMGELLICKNIVTLMMATRQTTIIQRLVSISTLTLYLLYLPACLPAWPSCLRIFAMNGE